jgi:hypothetical protein
MTPSSLAAVLRVLDAMRAGEPWRITTADLDAARDAVAALIEARKDAP